MDAISIAFAVLIAFILFAYLAAAMFAGLLLLMTFVLAPFAGLYALFKKDD